MGRQEKESKRGAHLYKVSNGSLQCSPTGYELWPSTLSPKKCMHVYLVLLGRCALGTLDDYILDTFCFVFDIR